MTHDDQDATPDEARAILAALHALTEAPAPREDCPFALTAPKARASRPAAQPSLFAESEE